MSVHSIGMSLNRLFIRIPNVDMADGWSANLLVHVYIYMYVWSANLLVHVYLRKGQFVEIRMRLSPITRCEIS